jgi:hypothetical protein
MNDRSNITEPSVTLLSIKLCILPTAWTCLFCTSHSSRNIEHCLDILNRLVIIDDMEFVLREKATEFLNMICLNVSPQGRATAQAASYRPLTPVARIEPWPVHVRFVVDTTALRQVSLRFNLVTIILPTLFTHLCTQNRRAKTGDRPTRVMFFCKSESFKIKNCCHCFFVSPHRETLPCRLN